MLSGFLPKDKLLTGVFATIALKARLRCMAAHRSWEFGLLQGVSCLFAICNVRHHPNRDEREVGDGGHRLKAGSSSIPGCSVKNISSMLREECQFEGADQDAEFWMQRVVT